MSKLYAVYTLDNSDERFLGQAYLSENDLDYIEQSFNDELQGEYQITLTDGDKINVNIIDSVEEIENTSDDE